MKTRNEWIAELHNLPGLRWFQRQDGSAVQGYYEGLQGDCIRVRQLSYTPIEGQIHLIELAELILPLDSSQMAMNALQKVK
jgi:hypothetical protein